jgi:hypothetical protein
MKAPAWKYHHTLKLSLTDCGNLDSLTKDQLEELHSALEALKAHNDALAPAPMFPAEYRAKVSVFAQALNARKVGLPGRRASSPG